MHNVFNKQAAHNEHNKNYTRMKFDYLNLVINNDAFGFLAYLNFI